MNTEHKLADLPSAKDARKSLARMPPSQLRKLAALSGVAYSTLKRIQDGVTPNPGIDTVRAFAPHVATARKA